MPRPLQILFIAFSVTVALAEIIRAFSKNSTWIKWAGIAPLLAALAVIFPYRDDLEYFDAGHQVLMILIVFMGIIYWIENRFQLRKTL
jgi:hypothetical protein